LCSTSSRRAMRVTSPRLCSTSTTVMPSALSSTIRSASRFASTWFKPASGSSSMRSRGPSASARATCMRFRYPSGTLRAGLSAASAMPSRSSRARAHRRASLASTAASAVQGRSVVCVAAAIITFSASVMSRNGRTTWWVSAKPSCARRWIGMRVMSRPSKRTVPACGARIPVSRRKSVVLPAPFGPMRPTSSPRSTAIETSSTACTPPKAIERPLPSSIMRAAAATSAGAARRCPRG